MKTLSFFFYTTIYILALNQLGLSAKAQSIAMLGSEGSVEAESPFKAVKDTYLAPDPIKESSKAIFQLGGGTGAFVEIERSVFIMTNHHIVGSGNCARSGCYVEAVFDLQIKGKPQKKTLFLTPIAANQDVDVSFFNFKEATEDGKLKELKPEAVLSFDWTQDQKKLLKAEVYVIGHPRLGLKKYSVGNIVRIEKGHILVSAFTLPGNSGSPILTSNGKIVGIHHSSVKRNDNVTRDSFLHEGKGSNLISILAVWWRAKANPNETSSQFFSIDHSFTYEQSKRLTAIFQSARVVPVLSDGKSFFTELLNECRKSLNLYATSSGTFSSSHEACSIARQWMGCQKPEPLSGPVFSLSTARTAEHPDFILYGNWCPATGIRREWVKLFQQIGEKYETFVGQSPLSWSADAVFQSFTEKDMGVKTAYKATKSSIDKSEDPISFKDMLNLVKYSQNEPSPSAKNISPVAAVKNYRRFYQYQYEILEIGNATVKLVEQGRIAQNEGKKVMESLLQERSITLHDWLNLERLAMEAGLL